MLWRYTVFVQGWGLWRYLRQKINFSYFLIRLHHTHHPNVKANRLRLQFLTVMNLMIFDLLMLWFTCVLEIGTLRRLICQYLLKRWEHSVSAVKVRETAVFSSCHSNCPGCELISYVISLEYIDSVRTCTSWPSHLIFSIQNKYRIVEPPCFDLDIKLVIFPLQRQQSSLRFVGWQSASWAVADSHHITRFLSHRARLFNVITGVLMQRSDQAS